MVTRREFLSQAAASGVVMTTGGSERAATERGGDIGTTPAPIKLARKATHGSVSTIKAVVRRDETVLRYGGNGDNWHMSWGPDDRQYVGLCDGGGFTDHPETFYNSRMITITGGPQEATFQDLPGYPLLGSPMLGSRDTRYYGFGTLAHDRCLYHFMSTLSPMSRADEIDKPDLNGASRFNGVKLIYSADNGRTWRNQDSSTPVKWESWDHRSRETMLFFGEDQETFSLLSVLQMGKSYRDNRDGYVYVYSPNGNTDGTMNELVMFRVPKHRLLDRTSYEYFAGNAKRPKWTRDIEARGIVHIFPRGWVNRLEHPYAWQPSVVYNPPLAAYIMVSWGMGSTPDGIWFGKPSYLGFWIAKNPWGPWTQIHEEIEWLPAGDKSARAYQPQIAPKWIAPDGKSLWLVWTDFQGAENEELRRFWAEQRRKAGANAISGADIRQNVLMMRKYMPYYAFNTQRVDLVVA